MNSIAIAAHLGANNVHAMAACIEELLQLDKPLHLFSASPADDGGGKQARDSLHSCAHLQTQTQLVSDEFEQTYKLSKQDDCSYASREDGCDRVSICKLYCLNTDALRQLTWLDMNAPSGSFTMGVKVPAKTNIDIV